MRNKKTGKPTFFVVLILILAFVATAFFGIDNYYGDTRNIYTKGAKDIRWGIDISGGVEAVFTPDIDKGKITDDNMADAKTIIETRLVNNNITDYEVYTDTTNHQVIVRFPWQAGESDFDATKAVQELGETAVLTFCEGETKDKVIMTGSASVERAQATMYEGSYVVALTLKEAGKTKFAEATARLVGQTISIWMDDIMISAPTVNTAITNGECIIDGMSNAEEATDLANKINAGSLPFALTVDDSKLQIISPTLGSDALRVMLIAGVAAFIAICILMILRYRLPGFVASIVLLGQIAGMVACITGYFSWTESFTMTIPGIAGMILSIGFGVDANVIAAERIKEEFKNGKTVDGAINSGFKGSINSIVDGNVTVVIIALVLMGAFGSPDSFMATVLKPFMFMFSSAITGSVYAFGYTLLTGVIFNFIMGVFASRLLLKGFSRFKIFRNPWLYCGNTDKKEFKLNIGFNRSLKVVSLAFIGLLVVTILGGVIFGANLDINFKGGSRFTYTYSGEVSTSEAQAVIEDVVGQKVTVSESKSLDGESKKLVVSLVADESVSAENQEKITAKLSEKFKDNKIELYDSNSVNPSVADSFFAKSIYAVVLASIFVVIYVGIRFRKIGGVSAGIFALIALICDIVAAFAAIIFFRLTIDANFMAVILTILGYSLNDTIVAYDRIRENKRLYPKLSIAENIEKSLNQVKVRTFTTSLTTFLAVVTIIVVSEIFGMTALRSFAIPMAIGIISGCLSSLFISAPLWVKWKEFSAKKFKKAR